MVNLNIKSTIEKYGMLNKGDRVLVCVSGGPDSVALLLSLAALKKELKIKLTVAHLNHKLRGKESDQDRKFVERLCGKLRLPLICEQIDISSESKKRKLSIEETARIARYGFFQRAAETAQANKIATAHTKNDQAETVLMRLIRGAGLPGLGGIPPVRQTGDRSIIRPLIETSRQQVMRFLEAIKVKPRHDSTNIKKLYFRNRIRLELLPLLEKNYNPNIRGVLFNTADSLRLENDLLSKIADKELKKISKRTKGRGIEIDAKKISKLHQALARRILMQAVLKVKKNLRRFERSHWVDAEQVVSGEKRRIELPGDIVILKDKGSIVIFKKKKSLKDILLTQIPANQTQIHADIELPAPGSARLAGAKINTRILKKTHSFIPKTGNKAYFDLDRLSLPLSVRFREPGDRIKPFGMKNPKRLKAIFIDEKVPLEKRSQIPLIISKNDIIWACGVKRSDLAKVSSHTKQILEIEYKK